MQEFNFIRNKKGKFLSGFVGQEERGEREMTNELNSVEELTTGRTCVSFKFFRPQ